MSDEQSINYKELAELQAERIYALTSALEELSLRLAQYRENEQKYRALERGHVQMLRAVRAELATLKLERLPMQGDPLRAAPETS